MSSDITVVITTYNQSYDTVRRTLRSVLLQKDVKFDVVIADDCSDVDITPLYRTFFKANDFTDYQIIRNERNVQTVCNLANSLSYAQGPFVKVMDAGDLMYSERTLKQVLDFSTEHDINVGFGRITRFWRKPSGIWVQSPFCAPRAIESYQLANSQNRSRIFKHTMETADWIPAPAQFYNTKYYQSLLWKLSTDFAVRYCQDFTATMALVDEPLFFLDCPIYWYEWGTGISTNGRRASRKKLYDDHLNFYKCMRHERPFGMSLGNAYALFRAKRFVSLYSPFYNLIKRFASRVDEATLPINDSFFLDCIKACDEMG